MFPYKIQLVNLIFALYLCLQSASVIADQKLVFSKIQGNPIQIPASQIIQKIYSNIGISVSFMVLPAKRSLEMSSSGKTDGEVIRILKVEHLYPSLLRIPTPVMTLQGYIFRVGAEPLDNVDQLTADMRIGIQRGIVWAENIIKGHNTIVRTNTMEDLVDKLVNGSIDVALFGNIGFEEKFKKVSDKLLVKGQPIFEEHLYHYVHQRHEKLIEAVDQELKRYKAKNQ